MGGQCGHGSKDISHSNSHINSKCSGSKYYKEGCRAGAWANLRSSGKAGIMTVCRMRQAEVWVEGSRWRKMPVLILRRRRELEGFKEWNKVFLTYIPFLLPLSCLRPDHIISLIKSLGSFPLPSNPCYGLSSG